MGNLRSYPWLKGFMAGSLFSAVAVSVAGPMLALPTPSFSDLLELQGMIKECRMIIPATSAPIYQTTQLSQLPNTQIGTLTGGTPVRLTGVFRQTDAGTAVQIYLANGNAPFSIQPVAWVSADKLTPSNRCVVPY